MDRRSLIKNAGIAGVLAAGVAPAVHAQAAIRWRLASSFPKSLDTLFGGAETFANAVRTNRDGTYTVTFHERGPKETKTKPVEITIDGSFATQRGRLEYAAARETKELWPQIFEKAYAQWKGGFDAIEGGMGATALEALTGQKTDFFPVTTESDPAQTFKRISDAVKSGAAGDAEAANTPDPKIAANARARWGIVVGARIEEPPDRPKCDFECSSAAGLRQTLRSLPGWLKTAQAMCSSAPAKESH